MSSFLSLLILIELFQFSNASMLYQRESFTWRASLDSSTAIASSIEQSIFSPKKDVILPSNSEINKFVQNEFYNYPRFLEKGSLTLGLCRVLSSSDRDSCNLRTSILPINILTFGQPRVMKRNKKETICSVQIPIVGGLLAVINPSSTDHGRLSFTWFQETKSKCNRPTITLVTRIEGKYQPTLAGRMIPVHWWRNTLYSATQRMFHEWVMWRYHRYVLKNFEKQYLYHK